MIGFPKKTVPDIEFLTKKLDVAPVQRLATHEWEKGDYWLCTADNSPGLPHGSRFYEDERWIILFDGDLISQPSPPWTDFRVILSTGQYEEFAKLAGIWALAAIDKDSEIFYLASDMISEYPCFYSLRNSSLSFSTELHAFCRLTTPATFNQDWLYDSLYMQFPVGEKTFLDGVYRLPSASVLVYKKSDSSLATHRYHDDFQKSPALKSGKKALSHALEVFESRLGRYPPTNNEWAMGLTAGFDARTILAFTIGSNPLTYTYGTLGCSDITIARNAARKLGLQHKTIPFDSSLDASFKDLMLDVVYLSGGLENSSRAGLLYAYRSVTENATRFPVIASGIGLDSMFRGHLGPALVSPSLAGHFKGKNNDEVPPILQSIAHSPQALSSTYKNSLAYLRSRYGELDKSSAHLLYFIYEAAPKYFGGEVSIARHFTSLRIPALDPGIIELAFTIDKSALSFSNFLETHTRDSFVEKELQAFLLLMASNGKMSKLPVYDVTPAVSSYGEYVDSLARKIASAKRLFHRLALGKKRPPTLQQNLRLYQTVAYDRVHNLLYSDSTLISEYLKVPDFELLVSAQYQHLFKVILTTEIILRLIKSRWQRFW